MHTLYTYSSSNNGHGYFRQAAFLLLIQTTRVVKCTWVIINSLPLSSKKCGLCKNYRFFKCDKYHNRRVKCLSGLINTHKVKMHCLAWLPKRTVYTYHRNAILNLCTCTNQYVVIVKLSCLHSCYKVKYKSFVIISNPIHYDWQYYFNPTSPFPWPCFLIVQFDK